MLLLRLSMGICFTNVPNNPSVNFSDNAKARGYERLPGMHPRTTRYSRSSERSAVLLLHEVDIDQAISELSCFDPLAAANPQAKYFKIQKEGSSYA